MKKIIAGHFANKVIPQVIKIEVHKPKHDEGGLVFEEDRVTPVMEIVVEEREVNVEQRVWVPQEEIEMTIEEEEEMRAHWAVGEMMRDIEAGPSADEQIKMLVEHGADYVRNHLAEIEKRNQPRLEALKKAQEEHAEKARIYAESQPR